MVTGVTKFRDKYRWQLYHNGLRYSGVCSCEAEAVEARQIQLQTLEKTDKEKTIIYTQRHSSHTDSGPLTLSAAIEAMFRADWKTAKSIKSIEINAQAVMAYFGKARLLSNITTDDIDDYVAYLQAQDAKGGTINRKLSVLSKVIERAKEKGKLETTPYIERQAESAGRIRYITPEEEQTILKLLDDWHEYRFKHVVEVLIDTGIRCGELLKLTASDIAKEQGVHGTIYLWDTKNGTNRGVPLTKRAADALEYLVQTSTAHDKIISEYSGWITKSWNRIRKNLGYSNDPNFVPHILRHTCCSRLVQRGASLKKVQIWMGHKTINTTMRYSHLCPTDIFDLPTLLEVKESIHYGC